MRTMRVLSMSRRERRGFHTMELLLAVPILAVLFLAGLAYGRVMMLRSGLTYAATAGAREAGKGGDTRTLPSESTACWRSTTLRLLRGTGRVRR